MAAWLAERGVELVVLAGYMQLLSPGFLARFPQRVINVHPALLPAFPGIGAVEQALAYGVKVFGVTVHFVDEGVDTGRDHPAAGARPAGGDRRPRRCARALRPIEHDLLLRGGAADRRAARVRIDPANPRRVARSRPDVSSGRDDAARRGPHPPCAAVRVRQDAGIVEFARGLAALGVELVSTGGTAQELDGRRARPSARSRTSPASRRSWTAASRRCTRSSTPGCSRVRDDPAHMVAAEEHGIEFVDLVCVNLYPFERDRGAARRRPSDEVIENIDIGGPTMIRAAAKNFAVRRGRRQARELRRDPPGARATPTAGCRSARARASRPRRSPTPRATTRRSRAGSPRSRTTSRRVIMGAYEKVTDLAYGENPHQRAAYYRRSARACTCSRWCASSAARELSFNNVLDLNSGAAARARVRGPGLRDHQAQQPVRVRRRRRRRSRPTSAPSRATRCPPSAASCTVNRAVDKRVRRGARQAVLRGHLRPALHDGGARGPRAPSRTCGSSRTTSGAASTSPSATSSA